MDLRLREVFYMQDSMDLFDDLVPDRDEPNDEKKSLDFTQDDLIRTSYLLVNVLMEILIKKGYIQQSEVDHLLEEVYEEYKRKRGK
jgi:hypothetical protein